MDFKEYQHRATKTAIYPSISSLVISLIERELACKPNLDLEEAKNKIKEFLEQTGGTNLYYPALGLAGEAGELANKIKKIMRDQAGRITDANREQIEGEIGDVFWYCAALASEMGIDLDKVAQKNIDKLMSRMERGALAGSGDNR